MTCLSVAELRRRLNEVRAGEAHLKQKLPVDNPYNSIIRLKDVARFCRINVIDLRLMAGEQPIVPEKQRALSNFFEAWDRGDLVKCRTGDEWEIANRHGRDAALAALAPAPRPPAATRSLTLTIDRSTLGLKVK